MVGKPRRNPVTDEQIIAHYQESHSVYKTAVALGISDKTVHRVLAINDVPRVGIAVWRRGATKFLGREQEIKTVYESGVPISRLKEHFGEASDYAFAYALRRAGAVMRDNPAQQTKPGEIDQIKKLRAAGLGQVEISLRIGRSQSFVGRLMRKHRIPTLIMRGHEHPSWTGGRYKDTNGYVRAWVSRDDPLASMALSSGHVLEHRLVLARSLGRPLLRSETVHHVNGDRADNRVENLQLRQGKHGKHVAMYCRDCGSHNIGHGPLKEQ